MSDVAQDPAGEGWTEAQRACLASGLDAHLPRLDFCGSDCALRTLPSEDLLVLRFELIAKEMGLDTRPFWQSFGVTDPVTLDLDNLRGQSDG